MATPRDNNQGNASTGRDPVTGKFAPGWKGGGGKRRETKQRDEYRAMLDKETPAVLAKVIELALDGDLQAAKIILDRSMPVQTIVMADLEQQLEELRERLDKYRPKH